MHRIRPETSDSDGVVYPDSDGLPMSDNTLQFSWIQLLQANLDRVLPDFVAGDLLWYPVKGEPKIRIGPDVLVALGRPKGYRGSYRSWDEAGVVPQVVVEVLSPSNTLPELSRKLLFYQRYGVREFWVVDPAAPLAYAQVRNESDEMEILSDEGGFVSPLLGIRFALEEGELRVYHRDGTRFLSAKEEWERAEAERQRAETERQRAETERQRAETERQRAETADARAEAERVRAEDAIRRLQAAEAALRAAGVTLPD
jgi:Uma2 family endonuclease